MSIGSAEAQRCRALASKEVALADAALLPRVRDQHLASAFTWRQLADHAERAAPGRSSADWSDTLVTPDTLE